MKTFFKISIFFIIPAFLLSCSNDAQPLTTQSFEDASSTLTQGSSNEEDSQPYLVNYEDFNEDIWVKVGEIHDDNITITANMDVMLESVNNIHFNDENNFVDNAEIIRYNDQFVLVFTGPAAYTITYYGVGKPVYDFKDILVASKTSCTTSDCSSEQMGCVPSYPDNPQG